MVKHFIMNNRKTKQVFDSVLFTVGTVIQRPRSSLLFTDINQEWLKSIYMYIHTLYYFAKIYYNYNVFC